MAKNRNVLSWRDAMKKLLTVMVIIFLLSSCAYESAEGIKMPSEAETITAEALDTMELPELIEESTPKEDEALEAPIFNPSELGDEEEENEEYEAEEHQIFTPNESGEEEDDEKEEEPEPQILPPDELGLVWKVPPTLEYTRIYFCICGVFFSERFHGEEIDPVTGLLIGYNHGGHGGPNIAVLVYDRERDLFGVPLHYFCMHSPEGMRPFSEITELNIWRSSIANRLNYVQLVDFSQRRYSENDEWFKSEHGHYPWQLTSEAFLGSFAVMYNGEFVTDFIFDGGYIYSVDITNYRWRNPRQIISMRMNGKWGIVDINGNETAPFIFDRVLIIDNQTAIAVYNGNYGLIDYRGNIVAPFVFDSIVNINRATVFARYNGKYGILDVQQTQFLQ